jgi:hypothetical protein
LLAELKLHRADSMFTEPDDLVFATAEAPRETAPT